MLAITHHYILHYCAWSSCVVPVGTPFLEYGILGDDIVIWNKTVAKTYLRVLKSLGVEVGLAKSVISPSGTGLEFAKKTLLNGVDVSPIPFKEASAAHRNFSSLRSFAEKYSLSTLQILRFLGYGYKVDPTKNSMVVNKLKTAFNVPRTSADLLEIFSTSHKYMDFKSALHAPAPDIRKTLVSVVFSELESIKKLSKKLY